VGSKNRERTIGSCSFIFGDKYSWLRFKGKLYRVNSTNRSERAKALKPWLKRLLILSRGLGSQLRKLLVRARTATSQVKLAKSL